MEANRILILYQDSADALLSAMKDALRLIDVNGSIEQASIKNPISNVNNITTLQINRILELAATKKIILGQISSGIVISLQKIIELTKLVYENPLFTTPLYLKLIQNQLTSIYDFIKKPYIAKDIDITIVATELVALINSYRNLPQMPQNELIFKLLQDIYQLCISR